MKHLDEGALMALLDGEMPPGERAEAEAHLERCGECAALQAELTGIGARLSGALSLADVAAPVASAQMAVRRRAAEAQKPRVHTFPVARKALLRAALLVLGVASVAAAAVPGSPVREFLAGVFAPAEDKPTQPALPEAPAAAPAPVAEAPAADVPTRALFVAPDRGSVRVVLSGAAKGLQVRTRLFDGESAEVYATGAAADARFRVGAGRIDVVGAGAGEVRIALPRGATTAYVEVNGRVYAAKEGGRLKVIATPAADPSGDEAVFQVGG